MSFEWRTFGKLRKISLIFGGVYEDIHAKFLSI